MISDVSDTPTPRAVNKRVLIAILLSLLLHAGAAGSAGVVYWLQKSPPVSITTGLSLSLNVKNGRASQHKAVAPSLSPSAVSPASQPTTTAVIDTAVTANQAPQTPAKEENPSVQPPSQPTTPEPASVTALTSGDSNQQTTNQRPPPAITAQPATTGSEQVPQEVPGIQEHSTLRTASIIEHMMVQNIIANPSQANLAIRVTEVSQSSPARLSDPANQHRVDAALQLPRQTVRLETDIDGRRVYSHAVIKEKAFSAYAHFIDRWDNDVYLSNDQIIGDFHVNSRIKLANSFNQQPRIMGRLTIGVNQFLTNEFQNEDAFQQGVQSGVGMIPMDRDPLLALMTDIHQGETSIHYFQNHTTLQFQEDGSVSWQSVDEGSGNIAASSAPQVFINEGRNRFELSGQVNGHFLVYSPQLILITGPVQYVNTSSNGLTQSSPLLGLVSRRSVEVASRSTTGSGDLRIDAAIYAARRFSVRRFDDQHQGTLHIYGSLAAGSMSATEPRFTTRIEKDPRLDEMRPPGFPLTGQTILAEWNGTWLEQDNQ